MNYTIDAQIVHLPKDIIKKSVAISGWASNRLLYINYFKQESYFQVTSESNECHRCSICQERMRLVGWRTGYNFHRIINHYSLYLKLAGVPKDLSAQSLRDFLGVPVIA